MNKKITYSPEETLDYARDLAKTLKKGTFIALEGDLGSGKTVFTKGIAKGLKVKNYKYVNSPTFVLIREYEGVFPLYHFDVYRLEDIDEMETVGYSECFYGDGITVVEWADKIKDILPENRISVRFRHIGEQKREIIITKIKCKRKKK